jgi:hypothetical protein
MKNEDLFPAFHAEDYRQPFEGRYVKLSCNQSYVHESKVIALALSIDKGLLDKDELTYICPVCEMQHKSVLEG